MAFNWQTFRTRALTAIVFAAVMLTGLLWNYWSFFILFSIIHAGCWWEYLRLLEKIFSTRIDPFIKYFFCLAGYLVFLGITFHFYLYDFGTTGGSMGVMLKWGFPFLFALSVFALLFQNRSMPKKLKYACVAGFAYISASWGLMVDLYRPLNFGVFDTYYVFDESVALPLLIILSIWVNDTMAYIVGSLIGKTPLSKISPKKTWEGTIGGIILSVAVSGLVAYYGLHQGPLTIHIMAISLIASVTGTIGDLLESKLKRMAGVKDSGSLMPGHGGFLDRFDSLLLATPFVWLYVFIIVMAGQA